MKRDDASYNIKFEDQLCHPVNFQPDSVSLFSRSVSLFSRFTQFIKNQWENVFPTTKYIAESLRFIDPEKIYFFLFA